MVAGTRVGSLINMESTEAEAVEEEGGGLVGA